MNTEEVKTPPTEDKEKSKLYKTIQLNLDAEDAQSESLREAGDEPYTNPHERYQASENVSGLGNLISSVRIEPEPSESHSRIHTEAARLLSERVRAKFGHLSVQDLLRFKMEMGAIEKVIELDSASSLADGLRVLSSYNILSAPIVRSRSSDESFESRVIGVFDVKQALDYLLAHMRAEQSDIEHELVWRTPLSVLLEDQSFQKQDFVYALQGERPMSFLALLKQAFGRGDKLIHRVILVNYRGDVEGTISQYDITRFLELHISDLGEVGSLPLSDLGLQHKDIHLCDQAVTVEQAFRSMVNSNHYGVAVVDAGKKMVANLSISEIRELDPDAFPELFSQSVLSFVSSRDMRPHSLPPSSSFAELLHLMITAHIHRVWLLDEQGVPLSVVTHSDLMRLICCAC